MSKAVAVVVGVLLLALLLLFSMTYTVQFHEVAVKTRYGQTTAQRVITEAGLHFKLPFVADRVRTFDTRIRLVETPLVETSTADGQSVVARAFLMWKVDTDRALDFFKSYESVEDADRKLRPHLHTALKSSLGGYRFDELVGTRSRLAEAEDGMLGELAFLARVGIEPVSVGVSQVLLPTTATTAVLERMEATRNQLAEAERSKGDAEAIGIQARANTLADKFNAFTNQRVEDIRLEAALQVAKLYEQMQEDEELAILLVHLDTLEAALRTETTFVISADASPWYILDPGNLKKTSGIPRPKQGIAGGGAAPTPPAPDDQEQGG